VEPAEAKSRVANTDTKEWAGARANVCAVVVCDSAKFVNSSNECANEAEIDERDEKGIGAGAVIGEEGCDCPDGTEDGNDE